MSCLSERFNLKLCLTDFDNIWFSGLHCCIKQWLTHRPDKIVSCPLHNNASFSIETVLGSLDGDIKCYGIFDLIYIDPAHHEYESQWAIMCFCATVPSRVTWGNEHMFVRMVDLLRRVIYILGGVADMVTWSSCSALVGQLFQIRTMRFTCYFSLAKARTSSNRTALSVPSFRVH
jgi:hypothetical protein